MAGFAVVVAIAMVLGTYAYSRVMNIETSKVSVSTNSLPSVKTLSHVVQNIAFVESLAIQHAKSSDPREMDTLEAKMTDLTESNSKSYAAYEALPSSEEEVALYAVVKADRIKFNATREDLLKLSRLGTPAANKEAEDRINADLRPQADKYSASVQAVLDYNMTQSFRGLELIEGAVSAAEHGILIGVAMAILMSIPIALFVVRSITGPIGDAMEVIDKLADCDLTASLDNDCRDEIGQMARSLNKAMEKLRSTMQQVTSNAENASASSQELSAAAESIASGAQEQASSLEETSASLEQITATVRQSADNARQASQIASSSRGSAEKGQGVVSSAIAAMEEINTASAKISDIISTIDEIAFQTNLLAVNAAVEAARAGEEGRGFAVVASEVRSLAQRSAGAAKEIKALIQDSLRKVERGSELVNRSGETLLSIVGSVKKVTDIVGEIAAAAEEQSTGVDQVNNAITQIDQVTQQNSAQTEELSSTAQTLSDQSARLLKLVSVFTLGQGSREPVARLEAARPNRRPVPAPARGARRSGPAPAARKPMPRVDLHAPAGALQVPAPLLAAHTHGAAAADSFEEF
jgi:methyl-accepting chemotaxis protein